MSQYTILDEAPVKDRERQPPWNPGALFFIMWGLYVVISLLAPLVGVCFAINWVRLGQPQKRLPFLAASAAAFLLPFLLVTLTATYGFPDKSVARIINGAAIFSLGMWGLYGQRPLFEAHQQRGGKVAGILPVLAGFVAVALLCLGLVVRNRG